MVLGCQHPLSHSQASSWALSLLSLDTGLPTSLRKGLMGEPCLGTRTVTQWTQTARNAEGLAVSVAQGKRAHCWFVGPKAHRSEEGMAAGVCSGL